MAELDDPDEGWVSRLSPAGRTTAEEVARSITVYGLVDMVAAWVGCVRLIISEEGEYYYDDYAFYLGWRDAIEQVMTALAESDAFVVRQVVEPADREFKRCTVDDAGAAMSRKFGHVDTGRWYYRRKPISGPIARSLA